MTRVLSLLGASLPEHLLQSAADNEGGFWESKTVTDLNDEILQALDSEWDDVFAFRPREYLSNFDRFYLGRALELLELEFNGAETIVLKDPRISVLTNFWERVLREAGYAIHYVLMVRNPLEVAESLRVRNGFPREKSLLLWSAYMLAAGRDTRDRPRTFVSYNQLMNDWRGVRKRIEAENGLPFPRDTSAAALEIDRYLDKRFQHHTSSTDDLFGRAEVPEQVKTIYRVFASACEGTAIDTATLEAIESELSKMDQLIGPLLADLKLSTRALSGEIAQLRDARADADNRANELSEQLESERDARACADARASSLAEQLEMGRSELMARIAAAEGQTARLISELEAERELRMSDRLLSDTIRREFETRLKDQEQQNSSISELLDTREAELQAAKERLATSERRIDDLAGSLSASRATAGQLEKRLATHFRETATLSQFVLEAQESAATEADKNKRIKELYDAIISEPRWWSILSTAQRSRLQRDRLRRLDIFDAQSYLRANPDVAAAGEDPVHHYIHHGIDERRPTGDH